MAPVLEAQVPEAQDKNKTPVPARVLPFRIRAYVKPGTLGKPGLG